MVRGIAALVVLAWHSTLAFAPDAAGIFANGPSDSLQATPLFALINGTSAVFLFFVLSSYVLTKRYAETRRLGGLLTSAAKRWPRLAGPVVVTTLASCLIFKLDLYGFEQAGAITGSPWLATFGYASSVPTHSTANFYDAAAQGAWRTFMFTGQTSYDSSLWTMYFELWGSFLVFAIAPLFFLLLDRSVILAGLGLAGIAVATWQYSPTFMAFPVGVAIYAAQATRYRPGIAVRLVLLLVAIFLLGYGGNAVGFYRPLNVLDFLGVPYISRQAGVAILGSILLVYVTLTTDFRRLSLGGKTVRFLGDLSFPLYLVHVPVICLVGSWALVASGSPAFGAICGIVGAILVSLPLILFNNWWVDMLNRAFARISAVLVRHRRAQIPVLETD